MKRPHQSKHTTRLFAGRPGAQLREVGVIGAFCVLGYLLICLATYSTGDPSLNTTGDSTGVDNLGGRFGAVFADLLYELVGRSAYLAVLLVGVLVWRGTLPALAGDRWRRGALFAGLVLALLGASGIENIYFPPAPGGLPSHAGGALGHLGAAVLHSNFGALGATLLLLGLLVSGITLTTGLSWFALMDYLGWLAFTTARVLRRLAELGQDQLQGLRTRREMKVSVRQTRRELKAKKPPQISPKLSPPPPSPKQAELPNAPNAPDGPLPALDLLDTSEADTAGYSADDLASMSQQLILKLKDFNVDVQVTAVQPGPVITRFEIEPAPGVKASVIVGLSRDLARALSVESVRVVENIPGKSVLGIELPNQHRQRVNLVDVLAAGEYREHDSPLALVLGKDIAGAPVVSDLMKMPHLLIAGTTGSGKSVCINALILSMLYKATPKEVRLLMVDPKFLELSVYDGIPHLLCPVITDLSRAEHALRWCVREMDRRFQLLAENGVRNIVGFNKKVEAAAAAGKPLHARSDDPDNPDEPGEELSPLPFIVVIIDELADLMMVTGKKVEELIIRIAQRARAAGLHLVLATQRPSVDVVTGLIKANVPTRIAFQVATRADSRTVLDQMGAEQLLGQGDMLFLPPGTSFNQRVHGAFVSDEEVTRVATELKQDQAPDYSLDITAPPPSDFGGDGENGGDGEQDPLYDQAVAFVTQSGRTSISALQRALRVGYNRAARMIDTMEQTGLIHSDDNGNRTVRGQSE